MFLMAAVAVAVAVSNLRIFFLSDLEDRYYSNDQLGGQLLL